MYLHAGHNTVLLSLVQQAVEDIELQQGLRHRRSLRFIGHVTQQVEDLGEGHASQSVHTGREERWTMKSLFFLNAIQRTTIYGVALPGKSKDVVYERGAVLWCEDADVAGQSGDQSGPALVSVVDHVEARVPVVQLQPLHALWHLLQGP